MSSHEQFNLNPTWHYMCWECWKKKLGTETKASYSPNATVDHCCWCGELHRAGIYWSSSAPVGRICNDSGFCHPRFDTSGTKPDLKNNKRSTYAERPKEEE